MFSTLPTCRAFCIHGFVSCCVVENDVASLKRSYAYSPQVTDDPAAYYNDFFANRFPCTTLLYQTDKRLDVFLHMVERSGARGVIFSGEKFCECEYFEFPYLEKRLREMGVATLFLEFGADHELLYVPPRHGITEQVNEGGH
ncbi:MAG: 2-hydroxyacyl-CoA dehydratase [Deltaproteobacteria bacterium]|jgi:benzoyl-CoA reductase/2-hydroxyglutaryl-CoA dehydratase subunit BcrC/BadD/HgdB|nr:2-hydroxyacyl-CoA dehydratase [Deltaproteobacteria bacterium]MBT4266879.1 2-hydroxyacyl-CoA dehydratase [Deltaproteobacteria bacterium]MBT4640301.1 2-hydroxyacyl-CoA dehydratase [Deltaproteobacteria bacterium]MBT6500486.1 2-hydroxyacyl-CoA dehydratase [Deltaproteobacteria bacterium]MBT6616585.1 2-hydroxyacyl-CoA dehydratase [Deltaproteobacteria bacterium]